MTIITILKRSLILLSVCLLMACGAPKKLVQLEDARDFYNTVSRDPMVARNAALELEDAKKSLQKAHRHWEEGAEKGIVEHYAYMTDQQLAIAQYRAKLIENESQLSHLILEHRQAQLAANQQNVADSKILAMRENREVRAMAAKASVLQRQMAQLQAQQTDRGLVLTLGHELFDENNASLLPDAMAKVSKVAGFLNEYPKQTVLIEGHTDSIGDDSYNQELSARRAEAVKLALVLEGVEAGRVVTRGLGESSPKVANIGLLARLSNRRVEIIFEKNKLPSAPQRFSYYQPR